MSLSLFRVVVSGLTDFGMRALVWACLLIQSAYGANNRQVKYDFEALHAQALDVIGTQRSALQDQKGFIWLAGYSGLVRYDGYRFKVYQHVKNQPGSISSSDIREIILGLDGYLWVSTGLGLNRYDHQSDTFTAYYYKPTDTESTRRDDNSYWHALQHSRGDIWLATETDGLLRFDPKTEQFYPLGAPRDSSSKAPEGWVRAMFEDEQGALWVGTEYNGLYKITLHNDNVNDVVDYSIINYRHNPEDANSLSLDYVRSIYQDKQGRLWIGTFGGGVNRFNHSDGTFTRYRHDHLDKTSLSNDIVWCLNEDEYGNLLVGTDKGLNVFQRASPIDNKQESFHRYYYDQTNPNGISSDVIRSILRDRNGGVWVGHFPAGISILNRYASVFDVYQYHSNDPNSLSHSAILSVEQSRSGNLWVGSEGGLDYLDRDNNTVVRYSHDPGDLDSLSTNPVLSILEDKQGRVWAGTWRGGLNRLDRSTGKFIHYFSDNDTPENLRHMEVWVLYQDSRDDIWMGTYASGLYKYDPKKDDFHYYNVTAKNDGGRKGRILSLYDDNQGTFWVGGEAGLYSMERDTGHFQFYPHRFDDNTRIAAGAIFGILEDHTGKVWFTTSGGGVSYFNRGSGAFHTLQTKQGLADNAVSGIVSDRNNYLWFSTNHGLSRLDLANYTFKNYYKRHGVAGNAHPKAAHLVTTKGELVFGSTKGLTIFDPANIIANTQAPPIVITDFQLSNKPVKVGAAGSPLSKVITYTQTLTLDHTQTVFSFEYAALNYRLPEENQYAYKLEGFDEEWNFVGTRRATTYTNLDPGQYVFHVKGSNNEGVWNEKGSRITIHILPPWWLTWWAYSFYLVFAGTFVWLVLYTRWSKKQAENERKLNYRLLEVDKLKDSFLANTSHELRTPLNGVIGLTESLLEGVAGALPQKAMEDLTLVVNSSKRLAYLIDDILDFSKLKEHSIKLNRSAIDLYLLTDNIIYLTRPLVDDKPIKLINDIDKYLPLVLVDENRLQQILYNLIGNAIKFTEEGCVSITTEKEEGHLWVVVSDTGMGIAEDKLDKVFEAFEQTDTSQTRPFGGTGLGLAVTKQLVELHGGEIKISSTQGKGTTVRFSLSVSGNVLTKDTSHTQENSITANEALKTRDLPATPVSSKTLGKAPEATGQHILVVDDEPVNRRVLSNLLSLKSYQVSECGNGYTALERLKEPSHGIDLVLLDVMMPGLSGYDVCKRLREAYTVSQLPILFLTAKSELNALATAYSVGGNDFLNKPVAKEELFARINTHLQLLSISRKFEQTNKKLRKMSTTDELTQLYNRKYFDEQFGREWCLAMEHEQRISVVLCDIDHFKSLNDNYGHLCGDECLRQTGKVLSDYMTRAGDFVARYGGEEFVWVCLGATATQVKALTEGLRKVFEGSEVVWEGEELSMTMSIGAYTCVPSKGMSPEYAIEQADKALYKAKDGGRNQCWCVEPS